MSLALISLITFVITAGLTLVVLPATMLLAQRWNIVARPGGRRQHRQVVPLLGGWAPLLATSGVIVIVAPRGMVWNGILSAIVLIALVGGLDDWQELPAFVKLLGQIGAAVLVVGSGSRFSHFTYPLLGAISLSQPIGWLISISLLVALMNMFNFLDGSDGLASMVGIIAALTLAAVAYSFHRLDVMLIAIAVAGSWSGFFWQNYPPAKVFLGESGASGLGLLLGVIVIQGQLKTSASVALVAPALAVALPLIDTIWVVGARLWHRQPLWRGDRRHLYHRLLGRGYSDQQVLAIFLGPVLLGAATAIASRLLHYSAGHGQFRFGPTIILIGLVLVTVSASLRLAIVLGLPSTRRWLFFQRRTTSAMEFDLSIPARKQLAQTILAAQRRYSNPVISRLLERDHPFNPLVIDPMLAEALDELLSIVLQDEDVPEDKRALLVDIRERLPYDRQADLGQGRDREDY